MLLLRVLATYANLSVIGSSATQQEAVPPFGTPANWASALMRVKSPFRVMSNDANAPVPNETPVAEPKSSVTSGFPLLSNARPENVGSAGPGTCVTVGGAARPFLSTGKT